jgi:hypothetical protein
MYKKEFLSSRFKFILNDYFVKHITHITTVLLNEIETYLQNIIKNVQALISLVVCRGWFTN